MQHTNTKDQQMAKNKGEGVRFRSKHERYRWRNVKFESNTAVVADAGTIEAMQNDPFFGEGRDFWEDADVAQVASAADAKGEGGTGGDNSGGDDNPDKKSPAKGGRRAAAKDAN